MLLRHAARAVSRTRVSCTVRHLAAAADTVTVSVHEAQSTTAQALRMIGWDDEAADVQAEIMTAAELCGNNQGLVKMSSRRSWRRRRAAKPTSNARPPPPWSTRTNPRHARGRHGFDLAAAKPRKQRRSSPTTPDEFGQLAFYAERQAKKAWSPRSGQFARVRGAGAGAFRCDPRQSGGRILARAGASAVALFRLWPTPGRAVAEGVAYTRRDVTVTRAGAHGGARHFRRHRYNQ